jgi:hypothetical protein
MHTYICNTFVQERRVYNPQSSAPNNHWHTYMRHWRTHPSDTRNMTYLGLIWYCTRVFIGISVNKTLKYWVIPYRHPIPTKSYPQSTR